ncbi:hypothetical protein [Rufibacter roseus]|uniref:Outer membrane protein beta-barrel domain-containing protein n=1 Tax=Rufibacter roseus TaxID=1567108 RepID=A0ABW2DSH3_9BACT|nr:hypothetical protein [Rufibacter roseus]
MNSKKITLLIFLFLPILGFCQERQQPGVQQPAAQPAEDDENNDYGWNNRFSFMFGGGVSGIINTVYLDPAINKSTNAVIIEKAGLVKPNISLGIVYTPFVTTSVRTVETESSTKTIYEYYPRGISMALFINPVSLSSLSETSLSSTVDLGLGIGYRTGNFSIFGTVEFFSLRQPRQYFLEQYKDNNKPYIINGETQAAISTSDNDIYTDRVIASLGIKLAYTFDIAKSFVRSAQ